MPRQPLHRRSGFFLILSVILVTGYLAYLIQHWFHFVQPVAWQAWTVPLPGGGAVRYENQSPRLRPFSPADTTKTLIWVRPDGSRQEYPASTIGGGYRQLEMRLRADNKAVWWVSPDRKKVLATLDMDTGNFTDEDGTPFDARGEQQTTGGGHPAWAGLTEGRSLGRRTFF